MNLEQRESMILGVFKFAYFGHVAPDMGIWEELERFCETYFTSRQATEKSRQDLLNKIHAVTHNDPLTRFPVSRPQKYSTLRWMCRVFCKDPSCPVPKGIENKLAQFESEGNLSEPEYIFKTFDRGESVFVTLLEENRELIGHGTTGLTSWQGALFLSDWAQNNAGKLKGKRILELGAGVGMLGISLLKTLEMREYIITDCHYQVLNFLVYNMKINFPTPGREDQDENCYKEMEKCTSRGPETLFKESHESEVTYRQEVQQDNNVCDVTIRQLDWSKFNSDDFKKVDIILGTDIVYERTILPALCHVIRIILTKSDASNPIAYIACTERSQTTLQCFETAMKENGLAYQVIQRGMYAPTEHILCSDVLHQMTKIYQVTLNTETSAPPLK